MPPPSNGESRGGGHMSQVIFSIMDTVYYDFRSTTGIGVVICGIRRTATVPR